MEFSGHDGKKSRPCASAIAPKAHSGSRSSPQCWIWPSSLTSRWPASSFPRGKRPGAAESHFARFSADGLLDKQLGRLSGGELQRVLAGRGHASQTRSADIG